MRGKLGFAIEARLERVIVQFGRSAAAGEPVAKAEKLLKAFWTTVVSAPRKADGLFNADAGKLVLDQARVARQEGGIVGYWEAWVRFGVVAAIEARFGSFLRGHHALLILYRAIGHEKGLRRAEFREQGRNELTVRRDYVLDRQGQPSVATWRNRRLQTPLPRPQVSNELLCERLPSEIVPTERAHPASRKR